MIAVTFALPAESSDFVRLHHRADLFVVHTGVGRKIAAERVRTALKKPPLPSALISAGFAGALDQSLRVGDLFLAENFSDAAPLANARLALASLPHHVGTMLSTDAVVDSSAERSQLAVAAGAVAVDMETQAIQESCRVAGVPMLSLRVISDTPMMPLPAPPGILFDVEQQRTRFAPLAVYLLKHPAAIIRLVSFAQRIASCRRTLASALEIVLQKSNA